MRSADVQQLGMFSYVSVEDRVPADHPIRQLRMLVDVILKDLDGLFETRYAREGPPSVPPERLLRASLLQVVYSVRSERLLMEQLDYNLLFRWFVGLNVDEASSFFRVNRKSRVIGILPSSESVTGERCTIVSRWQKVRDAVTVYGIPFDATDSVRSASRTPENRSARTG